jgi:ribosomal protein S21
MSKKRGNVLVKAKECRNIPERMIRRFLKKVKKEKIIDEVREKRYYKKPSIVKREKRAKAERLRAREELKRLKAQERRKNKKY